MEHQVTSTWIEENDMNWIGLVNKQIFILLVIMLPIFTTCPSIITSRREENNKWE